MEAIDRDLKPIDIVNWLAGVEERASALYSQASLAFASDKEFAAFLGALAEEEAEHLALLLGAAGRVARQAMSGANFVFDEIIRQKVEGPLNRAQALLRKGGLTKAAMLGIIAELEFCEWNEIFLYVIDTIKGQGRELQKAVAEIDQHRLEIDSFIAGFPRGERILNKVGRLRPLWTKRILVVEDDPAIANLIKSLLRAEAEVVVAEDGEQGLKCIRDGHFDVVVSDVEMPNLNGIELYKEALVIDPDLQKRFVFFTATEDADHRCFIESTGNILLTKPTPMSLLRQIINQVAAID